MWNQNPYQNNPPPPQQWDTRAGGGYPGANAGGGYPGANAGGYGGNQYASFGNNAPPPPQQNYGGGNQYSSFSGGGGGGGGGGYNGGGGYQPPPPQQSSGQYGSFAPPPMPPPGQYGGGGGGGGQGYGNQGQFHSGGGGGGYNGGGYQAPTGAPPVSSYAPTAAGYNPNSTNMSFQPPSGPPPSTFPPPVQYGSYPNQYQNQNQSAYQNQNQFQNQFQYQNPSPPDPWSAAQTKITSVNAFNSLTPHPAGRPPTGTQNYGPQFQSSQGGTQQPFFQYSQCNGKRKALLIGINYIGQNNALRGCINDVHNVQKFLMERYGYKAEDMVILTDDSRNARSIPTKANMIQAMQWLVRDARPNDALFFHYSGHGGQTKDLSGDEDDGFDEVVYPVDFKTAGHIVDDDMHELMVRPLPPGCRLTAIFDSCHSATALDLPYVYSTEGKVKEPNLLAEAGSGVLAAGMSYLKGDVGGALSGLMNIGKSVMGNNSKANDITKKTKTSPADVVMWSGCKDSQTSADASEAGKATGAMSYAFISAMTKNPQQSYVQLLRSIRAELAGKYSQKPQLSSSHPIDTNLLFIC